MKPFINMWRMDPPIHLYVIHVGFYGIYRLGHIMINWSLVTCFVERWRPETHTFHVPVGEMMITLQNVAIILKLRIHGPAVTETCMFNVAELCGELLGVTPPMDALRGSSICGTPIPRVPLTTHQPVEFLWISGYPIPHGCVSFIGIHISTKN